MKSYSLKIGILVLASIVLQALPVFSAPNNVNVAGGGIQCPEAVGYCEVSSRSLPGTPPNQSATGLVGGVPRTFDRWCISNKPGSGSAIFIPTKTFNEFQSFVTRTTSAAWGRPLIVVGPCCDPLRCVLHNGNCVNCIAEGVSGGCCDWACPNPTDVRTLPLPGFDCCQPISAPQSPLVGGVCAATCGINGCQPWENITNCCRDCGSIGDGVFFSDATAGTENQFNECAVCPGGTCP